MKLLWVKTDFLHPTTRGGQIRTLEMLRRLHARHEIHYVAFDNPDQPEGLARAGEYCTHATPVPHFVPDRNTAAFAGQLAAGLFSALPVSIRRYRSAAMRKRIAVLLGARRFDRLVCDFLFPAPNLPDPGGAVLFQHNVESAIWRRHVEHAPDPLRKAYLALQARRMFAYERDICRRAGYVAAVSPVDLELMKKQYGVTRIAAVETGVDTEYFARPAGSEPTADLVFVGSMDWLPNIDGAVWFAEHVLPLIRRRRPDCTLDIVGRKPGPTVSALPQADPRIRVTGTVPDVRPYLWGARLAVVPLRIGGGTRLKIYEAMAAGTAVVSTTVGAEGLTAENGTHIALADTPAELAEVCVRLLEDAEARRRMAGCAWELVASRFGWDPVVRSFEEILERGPRPC